MNLYINSRDSDNSQCELDNSLGINISPNMTTNMMNNPSHSPNLSSLFKYNEHLQSYKETTNVMNDKNTQEKFSYQLARSFLDFFYGKLASSMNPELDNCLNIQNNSLYKENNHDTTNQSYLDNGGRSMEWLANTSLSNRRQTSEQLNSTVNQTPLTSFNTFPCLLCGQVFHSHTELSMHVYTHIMTLNFHGARKSNHQMEQVLRFLHSEHYQTRDRPNGLLSEQVNSDSFSPLFVPPPPPPLLPPPPPPPVMATSVNNMPTTCSAAQTCPISESSSPSDPMYLFHTYLSQWLTSFSNPNSNYRPSDTTNYNHITNASWTPGSPMPNKSAEYRNLQGILTAYLCSLKESASTASVVSEASGDIPSTRGLNSANLPSIPLQHSLHKTENSSYYDILFGSKPYITPFPQS
ncbi:unnamed protein product [Heterobilharzia americana]|nr:unnamed protein product [Heterobilharzia americana]